MGAVGAEVLLESGHENRAYSLTDSDALTYEEVAETLSDVLSRHITYQSPSVPSFISRMRRQGHPLGFALVTAAIYTTARLGLSDTVTPDTAELLSQPPTTLRTFVIDYATCWR